MYTHYCFPLAFFFPFFFYVFPDGKLGLSGVSFLSWIPWLSFVCVCVCGCVCVRLLALCSFEEPRSTGLSRNFPVLKELRLKFIVYSIFRFSYTLTLRVHTYTKMTRKLCQRIFFLTEAVFTEPKIYILYLHSMRKHRVVNWPKYNRDYFVTIAFCLKIFNKKD